MKSKEELLEVKNKIMDYLKNNTNGRMLYDKIPYNFHIDEKIQAVVTYNVVYDYGEFEDKYGLILYSFDELEKHLGINLNDYINYFKYDTFTPLEGQPFSIPCCPILDGIETNLDLIEYQKSFIQEYLPKYSSFDFNKSVEELDLDL